MTVLDASMLIAYLDRKDPHHVDAETVLATLAADELLVHPLTMAEALVGPVSVGRHDIALSVFAALDIDEWSTSRGEPLRLARLRATSGLKLPDCCVLSAAVATRSRIATFDRRLASAARELGVEVVTAP